MEPEDTNLNFDELNAITSKAKESLKKQDLMNKKKRKLENNNNNNDNNNNNEKYNNNRNNKNNKNKNNKYQGNFYGRHFPYRKVSIEQHHKNLYNQKQQNSIRNTQKRSILEISNMPAGMEEFEMKTFFQQFGKITRLCLKRHPFGRSLRRGYVEFADPNVANIVYDAMDGTMVYGQLLSLNIIINDPKVDFHNHNFLFRSTNIQQARLNKKKN